MKLIVGLGNPGGKYAHNRHNVGFMAVDEIFDAYDFSPWRKRFSGELCEGRIGRTKCLMLKPSTYMNESGRSVGEAARFYKLDLDDVIVLYDEIDLVAGKLKVKKGGGNAGHNGLRSISSHLGNDYHRVRIGVGRPAQKSQVSNYVLRDFNKSDHQWLEPLLDAIARKFETLLERGSGDFLNQVVEHLAPFDDKPSKKPANKPRQDGSKNKNTDSKDAPGKASQKSSQSNDRGPLADMLNLWKKTDTDKE